MNIAIWGAGKFGQYIFSQLKTSERIKIVCFIDSAAGEIEKTFEKVSIVSPSVYIEEFSTKTDIVLVAFLGSMILVEKLQSLGIRQFGIIRERVYNYQLSLQQNNLERDKNIIWSDSAELKTVCMSTVQMNVVDYCNLNCKGCSHFANLFTKDCESSFDMFERDIKQLSSKVYIVQFTLLGGEVFLSRRLMDYIACLKKYMPKTDIELVSNGLLIPQQKKELLECIRDNGVAISITEYPPTTMIAQKIKDSLEQYHILYNFSCPIKYFGKNIDISGENNPKIAMRSCRESKCQFLREGKLYKCPFAALGNYYFDHYKIPICFHEGIDLYDNTLDWKEEIRKLCNEPIQACRYCGKEESFLWNRSDYPEKEDWLISSD